MAPTGPTGGTRARLQKLYDYHHRIADGLRLALDLLDGDLSARNVARSNGTLAAAIDLDDQRRAAAQPKRRGRPPRPTTARPQTMAARAKARRATARFLDQFSEDEPRAGRRSGPTTVAVLIRHGYLTSAGRDDAGRMAYLRTGKPFDVTP